MSPSAQNAPETLSEPLETVSHGSPVVVVPGATWRDEIRECAYPPCTVRFRPSRQSHRFHCDGCRYLSNRRKERRELELVRGELGEVAVVRWIANEGEEALRRVARRVLRILDAEGRYHGERLRFRVRFTTEA